MKFVLPASACVLVIAALASPADGSEASAPAYRLAQDRGCLICHEVDGGGAVSQLAPLAPSLVDVARRYRGAAMPKRR